MKIIFNIMVVCLFTIGLPSLSYADADAPAKNKCRSGKRYKTKVKVNGPGCKKEKYGGNDCAGKTSEAELLRPSESNCTCTGSESVPGYVQSAYAYAHAGSDNVTANSYKTTKCSGYKAGGNILLDRKVISDFNGAVYANSRFAEIDYDYNNNQITLKNFSGLLSINSLDYLNEFAIIQLRVDVVTEDANGEDVLTNILFSQASFKNGRLVIIGNGFDYSDFSNSNLQNGNEYTMNQNQKILNLTTNLNEDMVIQVSISTDVGNIMDGDSEIERSSVKLSTSLGMDNLINNAYRELYQ